MMSPEAKIVTSQDPPGTCRVPSPEMHTRRECPYPEEETGPPGRPTERRSGGVNPPTGPRRRRGSRAGHRLPECRLHRSDARRAPRDGAQIPGASGCFQSPSPTPAGWVAVVILNRARILCGWLQGSWEISRGFPLRDSHDPGEARGHRACSIQGPLRPGLRAGGPAEASVSFLCSQQLVTTPGVSTACGGALWGHCRVCPYEGSCKIVLVCGWGARGSERLSDVRRPRAGQGWLASCDFRMP